ncbi:hypothetical protein F5878DRAFT_506888, partial [Lentinula raphanica]
MQTGHALRQMFAMILLFCNPQSPGNLWNRFRDSICDDLEHRLRLIGRTDISITDVYDYGLY